MKTRVCRLNTFGLSVSVCGDHAGPGGGQKGCALCVALLHALSGPGRFSGWNGVSRNP